MPDPVDSMDDGEEIAQLMRRFYPLLLRDAHRDAGDVLGVEVAFDLANERVQETLADLAHLVRAVAETTRDEIRDLVGRQADEGWSVEELAARIADLSFDRAATRAELIARTETAAAYSRGSLLAYEASGVVSGVEWLTAVTDVCPICEPLDGQTADLGKPFAGGVAHPPAHPGCRCAIAPVVA